MSFSFFLLLLSIFSLSLSGHSKEEWRSRSIYMLLTDRFAKNGNQTDCDLKQFCGGNYKGMIEKLDYIQGMGFDAIYISPLIENTEIAPRGFYPYHGYHAKNFYKLNPHYGTEQDLIELIEECHKRDIWVMIDVVANHVGPVGTDYSQITPFNKPEHYHDYCDIKDYGNQYQVENCRIAELPDLKQENPWVAQTLYDWVTDIVKKYEIDGVRIDTVKHVPKWFWEKFSKAAGVYTLGEVFNGEPHYFSGYQHTMDGLLNYPLYYQIQNAFCGSMKNIEYYLMNVRPLYKNPEYFGTFVENHDNPRFLSICKERIKFKNAVIFSIFWEGIPVFYYGGEQYFNGGADPNNREVLWGHYNTSSDLYISLSRAHKLRKEHRTWEKKMTQKFADDQLYVFSRGSVLIVVSRGENVKRSISNLEYKDGTVLCDALNFSFCIPVSSGKIQLNVNGEPAVLVEKK